MASWFSDDRFTADKNDWEWDCGLSSQELRNSLGSLKPSLLSEFDLWEKSLFKSQSSALSCAGVSQSGINSKISTSSGGSQCGVKHSESAARQRWQSASRLAPDGTPRSSSEFELRSALQESSMKRTALIQRLWEVHNCLDTQTEQLKSKETQLQHSQNTTQLLELKQKQLAKALNVLKEQKEATEQSRFEESHRSTDLQDKVLQLEMEILNMKSNLDRRSTALISASNSKHLLTRTMPVAKDEFVKEEHKKTEREKKKLEEALREEEEKAMTLAAEKNRALKLLQSYKEEQQKVLSQMEEVKQRLSTSLDTQNDLQDQLSDTSSRLSQLELENELLSTKTLRLEDNIEDLKSKFSGALAEKDRLVLEKAELHQRVKSLELELQRSQMGREGFTQQVCDLHAELTQAKSQTSQLQQSSVLMKEELQSAKEVNEKLSKDLATATERLQGTLQQLHELEAEKLIQTNQIAALETERLQLIGEKEELMDVFGQGDQNELRKLKERCCQLRELQKMLEHDKKELEAHCQGLEKKVQNVEADYGFKEQELQLMFKKTEQEKKELKQVAAHWNERWLDVAMALQSTQAQLKETRKQQQENDAVSLEEMDGELKAELQKVWDMLKSRDIDLEEQKHELQTALGQVTQQNNVVQKLEQQLAKKDEELKQRDLLIQDLMRKKDTEIPEVQITIIALDELAGLKDSKTIQKLGTEHVPQPMHSLIKERNRTIEHLRPKKEQELQKVHGVRLSQNENGEKCGLDAGVYEKMEEHITEHFAPETESQQLNSDKAKAVQDDF